MNNYLCFLAVREVLENFIENELCYGDRAIVMMCENPVAFSGYSRYSEAIRAFGLHRLFADRCEMRRQALRAFRLREHAGAYHSFTLRMGQAVFLAL